MPPTMWKTASSPPSSHHIWITYLNLTFIIQIFCGLVAAHFPSHAFISRFYQVDCGCLKRGDYPRTNTEPKLAYRSFCYQDHERKPAINFEANPRAKWRDPGDFAGKQFCALLFRSGSLSGAIATSSGRRWMRTASPSV